jgi:S1-C subfamily serine protease
MTMSILNRAILGGVCLAVYAMPIMAQDLKPDELYSQVLPSVIALKIQTQDGVRTATAFLAIKDGIAVTSWHAVAGARRVIARFSTGEEFDVSGLIDRDAVRDVALVRVKVAGRPALKLAASDPVVGARAYVVGSPLGLDFSISEGLISQVRTVDNVRHLQFTCAASPGNSGGPLLNAQGEVVGVVSFQLAEGQNINFALPSIFAAGLDPTLPTTPWADVPATPATIGVSREQRTDPKAVVKAAKTIVVRQRAGNPELAASVERELQAWGRFALVAVIEDADLIIDLIPTSDPNLWLGKGAKAIGTLTSRDGLRLWSTVKGGDWAMAGYTYPKVGKAIVEELRRYIGR